MVGTVPLEQHAPGPDVDLLHDAVDDLLVRRAAEGGEVGRVAGVGEDQRGVAPGDEGPVAVGGLSVPGVDRGDLPVVVVVDVVGALGQATETGALPERQHRLAPVGLGPEVRDLLPGGRRVEPHDALTVRAEDLGTVAIGVGLAERRDEDVAGRVVQVVGRDGDRRHRHGGVGRDRRRARCDRQTGGHGQGGGERRR